MKHLNNSQKPVILCIGSNKVSGDMIGPIVGSKLIKNNVNAYVYGTLDNPINGLNIDEYLSFIYKIHKNSLIISIDAAMGNSDEVGKIKIKNKGIVAGAAFGRNKKVRGIGVVGVVCEKDFKNPISKLMTVEVPYVQKLAEQVSAVITQSVNQLKINV